jgi:hypothetical protein
MKKSASLLILLGIATLFFPSPVKADGGPIVPYNLWTQLNEGHQVAVVNIQNDNTAKVDLFISILDKTQQSHDINFFIPLGISASNFYATEQNIDDFSSQYTAGLDKLLRNTADSKQHAMQILFSGTLLSNGGILVPLWTPMLLSACSAAEPKPEASFQTQSSQIDIYDISTDTDIKQLIATTGLPPSVQETLTGLQGQKIAVVKMRTRVQTNSSTSYYQNQPEPGLHLSWLSTLAMTKSGPSFAYPLGTGGAWSKPIELTSVYITATNTDFKVNYPALGSNQSGFDYVQGAKINKYYQVPAYAVDEARGSFGRVMRITYTQSNPTSDVIITTTKLSGWNEFQNSIASQRSGICFFFALIIGLAFWFITWHFLMPRFLGGHNGQYLQWYYALIYPAINAALMIIPGGIFYILYVVGLPYPSLALLFLILAAANIGFFEIIHGGRLGVSRGVSTKAFIYVSLISSGAYLVLALVLSIVLGIF